MISWPKHGFNIYCLRFTNRVASAHARLASGWLARLCREGVEPSGLLRKVSAFSTSHSPSKAYPDASWAHARRKFHDVHVLQASPTTTEALARIGALYGIEEEVRGKPSAWRGSVRQARAKP